MTSATLVLPPRHRDEQGATLILALVFLFVIGLIVISLGSTTSNGIVAASDIKGQRSLEYAANGAVSIAIQAVRFSPTQYPISPPTKCLPGGAASITMPGGSGAATDTVTIYVTCAEPVVDRFSAISRVVDFYACTASICPDNTKPHNTVLQAVVQFDDFSTSSNVSSCQPGSTSTCGSAMTINSWVLNTANS